MCNQCGQSFCGCGGNRIVPACGTPICGCDFTAGSDCLFYDGSSNCLFNSGVSLTAAISALATKVCTLNPSGTITIVRGVSGQTTVATSVIGNTTYYTVGVSPNITNQITNLNNQVSNINNFIGGATTTVTSSTLVVTHPNSHTWNIENPSGTYRNCTGITYSDFVSHNSVSSMTFIDNTQNFTTTPCPGIAVGDTIVYRIVGQYQMNSTIPVFTVSLFNGSTLLRNQAGSPDTGSVIEVPTTAINIEIRLFITDITAGASKAIMNCLWTQTMASGEGILPNLGVDAGGTLRQTIGASITGMDLAALKFTVVQTVGVASANNLVNVFNSEVLKHY